MPTNSWTRALLTRPVTGPTRKVPHRSRLAVEALEDRTTPSTFTPAQIRSAYGINVIPAFGGTVTANGAGQTIAIVDAYNDSHITADLATFDADFGLAAPPSFKVVNQTGGSRLPGSDPDGPGGWDEEESLDVEWAHAIAPMAKIVLVETDSDDRTGDPDLETGVAWAAASGASVVSDSWGGDEYDGETDDDSNYYANPNGTGTPGVSILFSAGDSGVISYPASSPNVLSVGGTSLTINSNGSYGGETGWNNNDGDAGGGSTSEYESTPPYQDVTVAGIPVSSVVGDNRGSPDVSLDADPYTGVYVVDSLVSSSPFDIGGTSASCPMWAGLVAIADQGRAQVGLKALNTSVESDSGANLASYQLQTDLYDLAANPTTYASDFHDITSGYNNSGDSASIGYDLVTGLGSPIANTLIPDLVGYTTTALTVNTPAPVAYGAIQLTAAVSGKTTVPTGTVDFKYGSTDLGTATISNGTATLTLTSSVLPAGTDSITAYYSGDTNYATSNGSKTASLSAVGSTTALSASVDTLVYGQSEMFTATVSGISGHTPTGQVDFKSGTTDLGMATLSAGGVATLTTTNLPAGSDAVTAYYLGNSGYAASNNSTTVTVIPVTLIITANSDSKAYGTPKTFGAGAFTAAGLANGDTIASVTETSAGAATTAGVGYYSITAGGAVGTTGTLLSNYSIVYVNGTLTVTQAQLTITADNASKAYGTPKPFPATAFTDAGLVNGDTVTGVTETSAGAAASAALGPYSITASGATGAGLNNYVITYAPGTLTVTPAALTITAADSKVYGTQEGSVGASAFTVGAGAFTATGLVNGDTVTGVTETSAGAAAADAVGSYTVTASGAIIADPNNYTITYAPGTRTVTKAALTVTADDDTKVYGTPKTFDPTAFTVQGTLYNGDSVTGVTETSAGAPASAGTGTYSVAASGATGAGLNNYAVTYVSGTLTVVGNALTVTVDAGQSKTYGDADPALAYQVTSGTVVNGYPLTGALGRTPGENAGTYAINQGTLGVGGAYTITFVSANFTIAPRPITVAANPNQQETAVNADALLTYQVTGGSLVNGDTLTGELGHTGSITGVYTATQGTLTAGANYALAFVGATYTVHVSDTRLAIGSASGGLFSVLDNGSPTILNATPYPGFAGGIATAVGDVNGDGVPDVAVVVASGGPALVTVYNGVTFAPMLSFLAFPAGYTGGASIALADLYGTGRDEIIVGAKAGESVVEVFDGQTGALQTSFLAYPEIPVGVNVAAGNVNGSGIAQIVTTPTIPIPLVRVFNGNGSMASEFLAFGAVPGVTGVTVSVGDLTGDGVDQILIGANVGGVDAAEVFRGDGLLQATLILGQRTPTGATFLGPQLAVADVEGGEPDLVYTAGTVLGAFDGETLDPLFAFVLYPESVGGEYVG